MGEELSDLCKWLKETKGINEIDIFELVDYIPEYEEWLIENKPEWNATVVRCDLCGYKWTAVHHIDSDRLECPNCRNMTIF